MAVHSAPLPAILLSGLAFVVVIVVLLRLLARSRHQPTEMRRRRPQPQEAAAAASVIQSLQWVCQADAAAATSMPFASLKVQLLQRASGRRSIREILLGSDQRTYDVPVDELLEVVELASAKSPVHVEAIRSNTAASAGDSPRFVDRLHSSQGPVRLLCPSGTGWTAEWPPFPVQQPHFCLWHSPDLMREGGEEGVGMAAVATPYQWDRPGPLLSRGFLYRSLPDRAPWLVHGMAMLLVLRPG